MKAESKALGNVLLEHHRNICLTGNEPITACTIGYLRICTNAGVSHIYRQPGPFLKVIAEFCQANNWPPLNALAINEQEGQPGDHYDLAPGCNLLTWPDEARAAIACRDYPESVWAD